MFVTNGDFCYEDVCFRYLLFVLISGPIGLSVSADYPSGTDTGNINPILDHFRQDWDGHDTESRIDLIRKVKSRLTDCIRRLPNPDAYEYDLLNTRTNEVRNELELLLINPDDVKSAAGMLLSAGCPGR